MLSFGDYLFLSIGLLFLLLLCGHFPEIIELITEELIFVKLSIFDSLFSVKLPVDYETRDEEYEDDESHDNFF